VSAARPWALASLVVVASWQPAVVTAQAPPARLSAERSTFTVYPPDLPADEQSGRVLAGARR